MHIGSRERILFKNSGLRQLKIQKYFFSYKFLSLVCISGKRNLMGGNAKFFALTFDNTTVKPYFEAKTISFFSYSGRH
jgi:hypothetical protein